MSRVLPFQKPPRPKTKSCGDCRFVQYDRWNRNDPKFWQCGVSGTYIDNEARYGECGREKLLFEPKSPSFWSRLGDAIIARVRGKSHAD